MILPDEYLFLDGNSLSTDDLLQLGKGRYKIKVRQTRLPISTRFMPFSLVDKGIRGARYPGPRNGG